jgi:hypothetical protein
VAPPVPRRLDPTSHAGLTAGFEQELIPRADAIATEGQIPLISILEPDANASQVGLVVGSRLSPQAAAGTQVCATVVIEFGTQAALHQFEMDAWPGAQLSLPCSRLTARARVPGQLNVPTSGRCFVRAQSGREGGRSQPWPPRFTERIGTMAAAGTETRVVPALTTAVQVFRAPSATTAYAVELLDVTGAELWRFDFAAPDTMDITPLLVDGALLRVSNTGVIDIDRLRIVWYFPF